MSKYAQPPPLPPAPTGPIYRGMLWTKVDAGWQLARARVQGGVAVLELVGEPEPRPHAWEYLAVETLKLWGQG